MLGSLTLVMSTDGGQIGVANGPFWLKVLLTCQAQGTEDICKACGDFKRQGLLGLGQVFNRKVYVMQCHACLVLGSLTLVMNTDGGQIHMHR